MKLVKFVKVTEENKDAMARELGWESEAALLKEAEFGTMVGLWVDSGDDMDINSITGIYVARVPVVHIENRNLGSGRWFTTVYAAEVDLLILEPEVGSMSMGRYEQTFC